VAVVHLREDMRIQAGALRLCLLVFAVLAPNFLVAQDNSQQPEQPLPDFDRFLAEIKSRLRMDQTLLRNYTYEQRNTQKHLDKNGRVKKIETRLYEVFPADDPQLTYRRLMEKDGKPVPEKELKEQDRDYEKRRAKREKKLAKRSAEEENKAKKEEEEAIEEAFRIFEIAMEARETINSRPAIRFAFRPKPGAKAKSDEGKILLKFAGHAWFDEARYEIVRVELEAIDDVSIGFGVLAKLHKGAKGRFERRLFNDEVWLPFSSQFSGNLRLMLFKSMRMEVTDEFFDYRKFSVETSVSYEAK